jgi:hypothetical protein
MNVRVSNYIYNMIFMERIDNIAIVNFNKTRFECLDAIGIQTGVSIV